jgi:hypothetical protein
MQDLLLLGSLRLLAFFILVLKIPVYQSSAEFSGRFRLKGRSCKMFDIIVYTKTVLFYNLDLGGGGPAAARQPHFGSALTTEEPNRICFLSPFTPDDGSRMKFRIVVIYCNTRKKLKIKISNLFNQNYNI